MRTNAQFLRNTLIRVSLILAALVPAVAQNSIPAEGAAQIQALLQEKASRTPAQRKLDSQILHNAKLAAGQQIAPGLSRAYRPATLERSREGLIHIDIDADVSPALLSAIRALGGRVESSFSRYKSVRAWLPLAAAERLAGRGDVHFVKPAEQGITNPVSPLIVRQNNVRSQLSRALPAFATEKAILNGPMILVGPDTNGVKAHGADLAQAAGIMGTGVKIGVLSNGVTSLTTEQAANRLPAVTVLAGQSGNGPGPCPGSMCPDEGTAMLEIVYSMAPGAQLFYATGNAGQAQFATNILALQLAGCNIIVDDVTYSSEGVFQDSTVAQAVNTVTAAGALYFSSAANSGNLDSGTSGTWEGDFNPHGAAPAITEAGTVHSFGATDYDILTSKGNYYSLQWSDPLGGACDDYDLFILDPTGTAVEGSSTNTQSCSQNPFEIVNDSAAIVTNSRIVVVKVSGATRALHVDTGRGTLKIGTAGNTFGHNGGPNTLSVAAVPVATASGGIFVGGTTNPPESFSSDGPRKQFFDPAGNPITPGNFLFATNGGKTYPKVDFTATDGVTTGVPGFTSFFGTSAAAPHAAAIAALVLSAKPSLTPAQVTNILYTTSLPVSNFMARTVGSGIVMANLGVAAAIAPPSINKSFGTTPILLSGSTSLTLSITNPAANALALSGIAFTDTLPAGLVVSTPSGLTSTCGGGTITATAGSSTVTLAGATLASGATCTFSVNVTGLTIGLKNNSVTVTTPVDTGNTSNASVEVIGPPSITKSFGAPTVPLNANVSLSFTIMNPNAVSTLTGISFTDTLPAGLVVSTPNGLTGACGGTVTATAGSSTVSLTGGTLVHGASCTISVNVKGIAGGQQNNAVTVSAALVGAGNTSNAGIIVVLPPSITKGFGALAIPVGGSTSLSFTIANPNAVVTLTGVNFTDVLPSGLGVASPNGVTGSCGGGAITATPGSTTVSLAGASIAAGATCTFAVNVTGTEDGMQHNLVTVDSGNGGTGNTAPASITVGDAFAVTYAANLNVGDSSVDFTNTGSDTAENICVNLYAFDPAEELIGCCACQ